MQHTQDKQRNGMSSAGFSSTQPWQLTCSRQAHLCQIATWYARHSKHQSCTCQLDQVAKLGQVQLFLLAQTSLSDMCPLTLALIAAVTMNQDAPNPVIAHKRVPHAYDVSI
jgi:hypothetical protein